MASKFEVTLLGNIEACRTEAEISIVENLESDLVAVVFEDRSGVRTQYFGRGLAEPRAVELEQAIAKAKDSLVHYVNRLGENPPEGLTGPGLSLWLLTKDDGTAMGQPMTW